MATTTYGTPYVSGTDLVANWPAASLTVANSIDAAGYYIGRGISTQTGSMTTVLTDAGKTITMSNASANTVTIPANSSVAYVIGTQINILNLGAGACTPTAGAGVTINGTITALATNESASLIKTATNTWSYLVAATPATPGLSLVTPTSVAGTGVTLSGGEVSFSAATSVSVNGCFTSTYANYMVMFKQTAASATGQLSGRLRASGTDSSTTDYYNTLVGIDNNATTRNVTQGAATSMYLSNTQTSNGNLTAFALSVYSPQIAQKTNATITNAGCASTGAPQGQSGGLIFDGTTQFDGFTIFPASGTITGAVRFYGLRNS